MSPLGAPLRERQQEEQQQVGTAAEFFFLDLPKRGEKRGEAIVPSSSIGTLLSFFAWIERTVEVIFDSSL